MARAKRTDRADARRRYRQTANEDDLEQGPIDGEAGSAAAAPSGGAPSRRLATGSRPANGQRPVGFTDAMRAAWHRPDIRADLAALPWLVRTRAFYVPLVLVVAGFVALFVAPDNAVVVLFYRLVILPPAMAPIFIAGFFAKRASYLLGFIIAVVDLLGYIFLIYSFAPAGATAVLTSDEKLNLLWSAASVGPASGLVFAAAAAWYRRFLAMSSSQRARGGKPQQRPKAGRAARS